VEGGVEVEDWSLGLGSAFRKLSVERKSEKEEDWMGSLTGGWLRVWARG